MVLSSTHFGTVVFIVSIIVFEVNQYIVSIISRLAVSSSRDVSRLMPQGVVQPWVQSVQNLFAVYIGRRPAYLTGFWNGSCAPLSMTHSCSSVKVFFVCLFTVRVSVSAALLSLGRHPQDELRDRAEYFALLHDDRRRGQLVGTVLFRWPPCWGVHRGRQRCFARLVGFIHNCSNSSSLILIVYSYVTHYRWSSG